MNEGALVLPTMVRPALATANRRLLEAIETPPDAGVEENLDRLAAITWHYARESEREPDPGRLRQLDHQIAGVEPALEGRKRLLVRDARSAIRRATWGLEAV